MPGRQIADVVFCLDASGSMQPCFDALRRHVQSFVKGLESGGQFTWDLRLDFLAYQAGETPQGGVFGFRSLHYVNMELLQGLYPGKSEQLKGAKFFTANLDEFARALDKVEVSGDEATFIALDTALDYPWRESAACHRVVVVMTDEALETGVQLRGQLELVPDLIEKLHALRVKLFIIGPPSQAFDSLCAADRSEYQMLDNAHDGLQHADFNRLLGEIGKSISVSTLQSPAMTTKVKRALFGQNSWVGSNLKITGD